MHSFFWLFPAGIFLPLFFPVLPDEVWLVAAVPAVLCGLCVRRTRILAGMALGVLYGCWWGHAQLLERLPESLDKVDVRVVGVIRSLPDIQDHRSRFEFEVESLEHRGAHDFPRAGKLLLSWYGAPPVRGGERWRLNVRLRAPQGFANPGGFDYEGWLMSRGISATGYVRDGGGSEKLEDSAGFSLAALRQSLRDAIFARDFEEETAAYLAALVLGDKSRISPQAFDRLVATGTVHLMVVSGMHITLVAGLCFALTLPLCRALAALGVAPPAKITASIAAMAGAIAYGFIAGLGLPVLRALVMTLAALLAVMSRRRISPWRIFAMALSGVAVLDPMAPLSSGFWLSFVAVAGLLWWFVPRPPMSNWRRLLHAQFAVFIALSPWLVYFLGSSPLVAVPVNLLVVPWISLVVTPLGLAGTLLQGVPWLGDWLLQLAAWQLDYFVRLLIAVTGADIPRVERAAFMRSADPLFLLAGCAAASLLMLPRGSGLKIPLLIFIPALLLSRASPAPHLQVAALDVGQGLAVVVRAGSRTLVYDVGPAFSPAFDTGEAVVAPYLMSEGVYRLDRLMISHSDNDHAGGAEGLLGRVFADDLLAGEPDKATRPYRQCRRGQQWRWNGVRFRVLWPDTENSRIAVTHRNDRSCVLLIETDQVAILLPGDIEKRVEQVLAAEWQELVGRRLDLLVAAHHGSRTSSSDAFVAVARPRHLVFSAGFNHHFRHPHPEVQARFDDIAARIWNTAHHGAVTFTWQQSGELQVEPLRQTQRRYWRSQRAGVAGAKDEL
ncbi:MAG: DNA internalization-related competence protein ComEC/Rec2 [Porticoccaceae bacterium]